MEKPITQPCGTQMSPVGRQSQQLPISAEGEQPVQRQVTHLVALRAARAQHKAISRGLQVYFDAVTAERIPDQFLEILERQA